MKKATINPKNNVHNNCFRYAVTVTLNHKKYCERSTKNIKNLALYKQIRSEINKFCITQKRLEKV